MKVKAKKSLGQHFLTDESTAKRIVGSLLSPTGNLLEIGPGTGMLTKYLLALPNVNLEVAEIDRESIAYLKENYPQLAPSLYERDFLALDLSAVMEGNFNIIGNFPYNISSQIFFKILDYRQCVPQIVCMLQREVAERLASGPGNKAYGILSVLLQAWYNIEYLFTVHENLFNPPPKVKSGVIRLVRNNRQSLGCNEALFKQIVKQCFGMRRKTIRNSIKPLLASILQGGQSAEAKGEALQNCPLLQHPYMERRPEELSVEDFIALTEMVEEASRLFGR